MEALNTFFGMSRTPKLEGTFQDIDFNHSKKLLGVARHAMNAGYALIEFVDFNRDLARQTGVETIAIELSGMIDGGKLESVADTLHDATLAGQGTKLSEEGLGNLRRAERLLSDAAANLKRYGNTQTVTALSGAVLGVNLGQAASPAPASSGFQINITEILLIITIGILIGILIFKKN